MNKTPVYLDYQATTPTDPRVNSAMLPFFEDKFGNPHSSDHTFGWQAAAAVREARSKVAEFVNADDEEIIFTSGATESCNLAIRGAAKYAASTMTRNRIITVATEHAAVFNTALDLRREGFDTVVLPVNSEGILDLNTLDDALDDRTLIVSVMAANNEIGVLQPLAAISERCKSVGAIFHTDAAQAGGRLSIDVEEWGIDLLSLSAHKMYGPKGVGALYAKSGTPISPISSGGGQERGMRSGTLAPALVVGFAIACELASEELEQDHSRLTEMTASFLNHLRGSYPDLRLFGHPSHRLPGSVCISINDMPAELVIRNISSEVAVSSGSACTSTTTEPSRVLKALGFSDEEAATGIRVSLGRFTTTADIEAALSAFVKVGSLSSQGYRLNAAQ